MSEEYVRLPKSDWLAIVEAMRAKEGSSAGILSGELAAKITAITTGITPAGTKDITSNGTHDVTQYAAAEVNVPIPSGYIKPAGTKSITSNGDGIDVNGYQYADVSVPVPSGYVLPEYTFDYAEVTLEPGNGSGFSAGTYLPNGYMFYAAEASGRDVYVASSTAAEDAENGSYVHFSDFGNTHGSETPAYVFLYRTSGVGVGVENMIIESGAALQILMIDDTAEYYQYSSDRTYLKVVYHSDGNIEATSEYLSTDASSYRALIGDYTLIAIY